MTPAELGATVARTVAELAPGACADPTPRPHGDWARSAVYAVRSAARLTPGLREMIAVRLNAAPGITATEPGPGGLLLITVATPEALLTELIATAVPPVPALPGPALAWPDHPRTFENPGFAVRFAWIRATRLRRWAGDLGVPVDPPAPGPLPEPGERRLLRLLAEHPSRRTAPNPRRGLPTYLEHLADAYHDVHEHHPALPWGDHPVTDLHLARLALAFAVQKVLEWGLGTLGENPPEWR
ncbi:DALR anticodon-binding domain-containing protein [Rhizohabitans arisaemae]|uniref:DALR anticodon-binding domain-containing protein n=1 Tax=Rhizohabitans arisaemae TaxID=2720610 RepID=UPI0024B11F37|nr:DALR anticodon-binding domain-containing protein [Rhizohabitans arisaemae]